MNAEVKNNEVAATVNQNNNMNEVPVQTTTPNETKESKMEATTNSTTVQTTTPNETKESKMEATTNSTTVQTTAATTTTTTTPAQAPAKAKRSNHKKTEAERVAEKLRAKEERAKELDAMSDEQKKEELERIEHRIKQINNGERRVGAYYKQLRDEKLYELSEYNSSFTFYCRVVFKESRSNIYRKINYIEILEIIGETTKTITEKTIRPLTCFKITSANNEEKDKDLPEQYDTEAIRAVWKSVKAAKKSITERLVKEYVLKFRKARLGADNPNKVYVPSMNKCFDRSSFVDELIKEKKTAAGLLSVTKEMKDILTVEELEKIKEESDSLTDKEFEEYKKPASPGGGYIMTPQEKSA